MSGIVTIPVLDFNKTLFAANFPKEESINIKYDVRRINITLFIYILGIR